LVRSSAMSDSISGGCRGVPTALTLPAASRRVCVDCEDTGVDAPATDSCSRCGRELCSGCVVSYVCRQCRAREENLADAAEQDHAELMGEEYRERRGR